MKMKVVIIPSQLLLPLKFVQLGRFVTSIENPCERHHQPSPALSPTASALTRAPYTSDHRTVDNTRVRSTLLSLLATSFSSVNERRIRVETDEFKTYTLDNSDAYFDHATQLKDTQVWIEQTILMGKDMYLIVGLHTIKDARIIDELVIGKGSDFQAKLPVGSSFDVAGPIAPFLDGVGQPLSFQKQTTDEVAWKFVADGEQVCAIEYRKVTYRWLFSRSIERSRLSKVRVWPSSQNTRGDDDEEDDLIEVSTELLDEPDEGWKKELFEDSDLCVLAHDV